MNWMRWIVCSYVIAIALAASPSLRACPLCAEAIANANADQVEEDKDNFPAAMNQSIYFMLAVPYSMLGIVGFMIYRGVKKNEEYRIAACGLALADENQEQTPAASER